MPEPRHLKAAPIVEAVIDIQVGSRPDGGVGAFRKVAERFGLAHRIEELHTFSMELIQKPGVPVASRASSPKVLGLRCFSKDEKTVVQLRQNGFTFSRMAPYTSWETILPQASEIFAAYSTAAGSFAVSRIAVRNINRLLLPAQKLSQDPASFFYHPPVIPNTELGFTEGWMTRLLLRHPNNKSMQGFLTLATEDQLVGDNRAIILDVDVFDTGNLPADNEELMLRLSPLRFWKNQIFFSTLKEDFLKLYE